MRKFKWLKHNDFYFYVCVAVFILLFGLVGNSLEVFAKSTDRNLVNIYFFHSNSCSHCKSEEELLDILDKKYSNVVIYRYEVHEGNSREIMEQVEKLFDVRVDGVPLTIIGESVYIGYSEEISKLQFIKTIEYYSKYGYEDKIGSFLQLEKLPTFPVEKNQIELEEFLDSYKNYNLFGGVYTDDLYMSVNTVILGALSQFNLIKILSFGLVVIFLNKVVGEKNKFILLCVFFGMSFLMSIERVISNTFFTLGIVVFIILIFVYGLVKYRIGRSKNYLWILLLLILVVATALLERIFLFSYDVIFKELIDLYLLSGMERLGYYFQYLFMVFSVNFLFILVFLFFQKFIWNKIYICR